VSALIYHRPLCPGGCLSESASPVLCGCPERLRLLIRRIAGDDRGAFVELFDQCSALVVADLCERVADRHRVAGVVAGTFVEVWWLAGCHVDADTDVMVWLGEIVQRRVADSRPAATSLSGPAVPGLNLIGPAWTQGIEVELAGLLGRHYSAR
jgi:hypothetical protein